MQNQIACAPCCWGVEDSKNGENPSWGKVLMDASDGGYRGIELGPDGFFPEDDALLTSACRTRGLQICAGKLQLPFSDSSKMETILADAEKVCSRLNKLQVKNLLLMEGIHPERLGVIGQSAIAPRLSSERKSELITNLNGVIAVAEKYGLRCLLHPGVGGYIGFKDEIDFVLREIPSAKLGLCIDVGHTFLDGMNPSGVIEQYGKRIEHVHLKDVSIDKLRIAIRDKTPWFEAYSAGLVTPLGEGDIKLNQVILTLKEIDYRGWLVVEHEHCRTQLEKVRQDLKRSRAYLTELGV